MGCNSENKQRTSQREFAPELLAAVKERAKDDRLSCTAARALAAELHISVAEMGEIANQLGIKIKKCELGCF